MHPNQRAGDQIVAVQGTKAAEGSSMGFLLFNTEKEPDKQEPSSN